MEKTMGSFREFLQGQNIDESQIDAIYNKAHIAVELAKIYDRTVDRRDLLNNIAVIANLAAGAYGVYNSGENRKIMQPQLQQSLIYYGKVTPQNLNNIPKATIKKYYPQIKDDQIKNTDTIHVNIRRILNELPNDEDRIMEIASTILHEATHEWERENQGVTSEVGPLKTEAAFKAWMQGPGKQVLQGLMAKNRNLFQPQNSG